MLNSISFCRWGVYRAYKKALAKGLVPEKCADFGAPNPRSNFPTISEPSVIALVVTPDDDFSYCVRKSIESSTRSLIELWVVTAVPPEAEVLVHQDGRIELGHGVIFYCPFTLDPGSAAAMRTEGQLYLSVREVTT